MKHPRIGQQLDLAELPTALTCIVHLSTQPPNVVQQVTLRPDKVSSQGYIRMGETQGDEALGWILPEHIQVLDILGIAVEAEGKWTVHPIPDLKAVA